MGELSIKRFLDSTIFDLYIDLSTFRVIDCLCQYPNPYDKSVDFYSGLNK